MAEEVAEVKEVGEANETDKKGGGSVAILIVLSILVLILTPVITIFSFKAVAQQKGKVEEPVKVTREVVLPQISVNIKGTNATRFAQIDVVVAVNDAKMVAFFEQQSDTTPNGMLKRIQAAMITLVGDKNLDTLASRDGKLTLAKEIKDEINDLVRERTTGMVTEVYFSSFLIQ